MQPCSTYFIELVHGLFVINRNAPLVPKPFQEFYYYNPKQKGSCSIKALLPTLTDISYEDLEVNNGALAQVAYQKLETANKEYQTIRKHLLEYCELDTEAMVHLINKLKKLST